MNIINNIENHTFILKFLKLVILYETINIEVLDSEEKSVKSKILYRHYVKL
jgi:hypothetical protein